MNCIPPWERKGCAQGNPVVGPQPVLPLITDLGCHSFCAIKCLWHRRLTNPRDNIAALLHSSHFLLCCLLTAALTWVCLPDWSLPSESWQSCAQPSDLLGCAGCCGDRQGLGWVLYNTGSILWGYHLFTPCLLPKLIVFFSLTHPCWYQW